jgi:YidC/Oxa1 family membrane protein insertase
MPGWTQFIEFFEALLLSIDQVVGNAGLSIIIFTLIIKVITLPLTLRSIRSTKEMQRLQPVIKEINKRYKDDKAKAQAETMRLYQEHGVNPMGGCLPMIVQLPIFFALYSALTALIHVSGTHVPILWIPADKVNFSGAFLWVPNLAEKDPLYIWPVLSGIFQFVTQRMSMAYGASKNGDPQQVMMNRIMQFTPVYLTVIYLNFAAGPVIYWTFSGIFTALQTFIVNGFGSLPEVPGLHWLPKRVLPPTPQILEEIAEVDAEADAAQGRRRRTTPTTARRAGTTSLSTSTGSPRPPAKGLMGKMMEQAIAAQEAKTAPQATTQPSSAVTTVRPSTVRPSASITPGANGSARKGFMAKMEQALAAQEAQRAAQQDDYVEEEESEPEVVEQWSSTNGRTDADGLSDGPTTGSSLPRKRRGKH